MIIIALIRMSFHLHMNECMKMRPLNSVGELYSHQPLLQEPLPPLPVADGLNAFQVLLSSQALVLNEKPFFNEPGTSGSRGRKVMEKKATEYSQGVFVLCCKSVLCLLRRPSVIFEALVASHFRERGVAILTACDAYRSGLARVGGKIIVADAGLKTEVSPRFKVMMEKVYGDLVEAFAKNGALVEQFVKQLAGEKGAKAREAKKKHEKRKKARGAIRKKLMAILEKIWVVGTGLKKSSIGNDQVKVVN